jgi:bacillopeptidase F (M6 metalloprotease family)
LTDNRQSVKILDVNRNVLQEVTASSDDASGWQFRTFDLTDYAGQTLYLEFGVFNDGDFRHKRAAMYVDDVSLTMIPTTALMVAQCDYPR